MCTDAPLHVVYVSLAEELLTSARWRETRNRGALLESPFDIPTYRYEANCCINSRLYEPTGIRLTTASQTLTAINAGYERIASPVLEVDVCQNRGQTC